MNLVVKTRTSPSSGNNPKAQLGHTRRVRGHQYGRVCPSIARRSRQTSEHREGTEIPVNHDCGPTGADIEELTGLGEHPDPNSVTKTGASGQARLQRRNDQISASGTRPLALVGHEECDSASSVRLAHGCSGKRPISSATRLIRFRTAITRLSAFTDSVGKSGHDPFFSLENPALWITSLGYQLYSLHDDSVISGTRWTPDNASTKQIKAYRSYMLPEVYHTHQFFGLEDPDAWINPLAFQAYMDYTDSAAPAESSRAASRADSSVSMAGSSAMSVDEVFDSGNDFPPLFIHPDSPSDYAFPAAIPTPENVPTAPISTPLPIATGTKRARKGKGKINEPQLIVVTRQLKVNIMLHLTTVPPTFDIPRIPTAILLDVSASVHLLTTPDGRNQESWEGLTSGHTKGDVNVYGFFSDPKKQVFCRRVHLRCNGIDTCEFFDADLLAGVERYEPDVEAMRELWVHEMDRTEDEAASGPAVLARFYCRALNSKCKVKCGGVPILVRLSHGPSTYGKNFFIGCSKWKRSENHDHIYWFMPHNVDEEAFKYAFENNGRLLNSSASFNETCVLTVHPRLGLTNCPFSHIIDGRIRVGAIKARSCDTEMIIFVPVDQSAEGGLRCKAIVVMRNAHNHPMHPASKPNAEDKLRLGAAVDAAGLTRLTAQKLLNAPSTLAVYDGRRVMDATPAFADTRKVRALIVGKKKIEHPQGMGFEGVVHLVNVRELHLPMHDRYIHAAITKGGFRVVVTMHPQIVMFIHRILSLNIDFTFKRVEGKMDEWEVAGFLDRVAKRRCFVSVQCYTFASLFCDTKTTEAFAQLFTELFDAITQVTGEPLKMAPFYPGAKCRVVMMDGEVPQALGYAKFLASYNDPNVSQIWTREPTKLLAYNLRGCNPHFLKHIEDLPDDIPRPVITRLKSIMGLATQEEIDAWHAFCAAQEHAAVKNWYAHKLANPWILPSINKFLSKISSEDWDITPHHSNLVESAHAARNAETSIHAPLLDCILQSQGRDNIKAAELAFIMRDGVRKKWNTSGDREKLAAQRKVWTMRKAGDRNDQLTSYDALKVERDAGADENKLSLERQKVLEAEIKSLQEEMKLDRHRTDLKEQVNALRKDIDEEKSLRRAWGLRRSEIDKELDELRKGPLAGARIKGRRPGHSSEDNMPGPSSFAASDDASFGSASLVTTSPSDPAYDHDGDSDAARNTDSLQADYSIGEQFETVSSAANGQQNVRGFEFYDEPGYGTNLGWDNDDPIAFDVDAFMAQLDASAFDLSANGYAPVSSGDPTEECSTSYAPESTRSDPSANEYSDTLEYFEYPVPSVPDILLRDNDSGQEMSSAAHFGGNGDGLGYPMHSFSTPAPHVLENDADQEMLSSYHVPVDWANYRLSQELPTLPPPPPSQLSEAEPEESAGSPAADSEEPIAVQAIRVNADFSEENIVSGKRKRTISTRAAGPDGPKASSKKGPQAI
ncbi:hypothetical protein DFH06DRAFT_1418342 [Mycena polygramma]|nr:hypothetical protein DFH06DRAFT_1418342 [Mycena polygramma]